MTLFHDCLKDGGVVGSGNLTADIMLIGIAPGEDEWKRSKKPFTGMSGKLLDTLLLDYGKTPREMVFATNLICWWNDKPTKEEIAACSSRLVDEITRVKPRLIITLGKLATETLLPTYTFGKTRGGFFWHNLWQCWIMPTYHPAAYLHKDAKARVDIADGVRDFKKLVLNRNLYLYGEPTGSPVRTYIPQTLADCNAYLAHFQTHKKDDVVAIDVETHRDGSGMLSIAFACGGQGKNIHTVAHFPQHLVYGPKYELLKDFDLRWTFHNGQFDVNQIEKHLGVRLKICEDTMLMSYSLDERGGTVEESDSTGIDRAVGIHGLKSLSREYYGAGFYEEIGGSIEEKTPAQLAQYNSLDAFYTLCLQMMFEPMQREEGVREYYEKLLIPGANIQAEINKHGIYIDTKELVSLGEQWTEDWLNIDTEVDILSRELEWTGDRLNIDSPQQLAKLLYDINEHLPTKDSTQSPEAPRTTRRGTMLELAEEPTLLGEFCRKVLEWRARKKDLDDYVFKIDDAIDASGRIHPECLLHGARNGRTSYHNPPMQTVPKPHTVGEERARVRRIVSVPKGYKLVEADNRQSELWAAAMVSGDEAMLQDLRSGDFHSIGAQEVFHVTTDIPDWKLYRESFKRVVYNNLYGGGPDSLVGKGTHNAGKNVVLSSRWEAVQVINNFNKKYHKFYEWREREKAFVIKNGYQVSASGRRRRYYWVRDFHALNQTVNTPISCLSHDFLMMAWIELHPLLKEYDSHILMEVHDSILFEIKTEHLIQAIDLIERVMTKPRFGFEYGIPIDIQIGDNWFDMEPYGEYEYREKMARNSRPSGGSLTQWRI